MNGATPFAERRASVHILAAVDGELAVQCIFGRFSPIIEVVQGVTDHKPT